MTKRVLRNTEAAEYIGLSPSTLEKRRLHADDSPRYIKLGGRAVGYVIEDLDAWLEKKRKETKQPEKELGDFLKVRPVRKVK